MNVEDFVSEMKKTLADERNAIRKLDAKGVVQASAMKEALLKAMMNVPADEKPTLAKALKELKGELRRNLILLAHARDCVRDVSMLTAKNPRRPRLQASL